ncbi:hypothetical protein CA54_60020 [Symmachiella macrocystis]|uniref:SAF domain-containing protein n=1 Tax=Symmachiella macrocystis TaxID=2527985 RepID=A0A5C6B4A1_9PLAN|nr:hypothetical protein [Symmachiella macrocystis]TWU05314.1 hypothetical protein CA54_60020 [Symmachiella macrocystis]
MNHLTKLALPVGLGLVAAFLNYKTVSARIQPQYFVRVSEDLQAGESFSGDNLTKVSLQGERSDLSKTFVPWKERAVLYQRPVPRNLQAGDIVFWRDATAPTLKLSAEPGELEFHVAFRDLQAVPKDIRAGQQVSFRVGTDTTKLRGDARTNYVANATTDQKIGPFRVLEVGGFDVSGEEDAARSNGYIKVAVKWDDERMERLSQAMETHSVERVLGVFLDG